MRSVAFTRTLLLTTPVLVFSFTQSPLFARNSRATRALIQTSFSGISPCSSGLGLRPRKVCTGARPVISLNPPAGMGSGAV